MSCEKCGREIKNYGVFLGGIRCANNCRRLSRYKFKYCNNVRVLKYAKQFKEV